MDPANPKRSRSGQAMADVRQKPSRGHCGDGLFHRPNAHVWCSVLLSPLASHAIAASRSFLGSGNFCEKACELTTARLNHVEILSRSTVGTNT
jgi:hypothetical protein